ncbi:MAG: choice-of-anchor D domain-containing protein, partial [Candidatus Heimdallarchaeota archaeon]|nr:choice-of-anchor D domain-containing protein [Candidatus Heimdallarchaeota archaeon]
MFKSRLKLTVFCMLFVASAIFAGCSSDSKTLKLSPSKLDFGTVNIGDTFDIEVTMTNKYGKDVTVTNMDISGSSNFSITSGGSLPFNLINKEEHKFTITFTPTTGGPIAATLFIT